VNFGEPLGAEIRGAVEGAVAELLPGLYPEAEQPGEFVPEYAPEQYAVEEPEPELTQAALSRRRPGFESVYAFPGVLSKRFPLNHASQACQGRRKSSKGAYPGAYLGSWLARQPCRRYLLSG
jgi:hypothetical protein